MATGLEAAGHVGAHPSQTDHTQIHTYLPARKFKLAERFMIEQNTFDVMSLSKTPNWSLKTSN